jgi:hypothetical protein
MDLRVNIVGIAVFAICAGTVWSRVSAAPPTATTLPATPAQRLLIARAVAVQEPGWRKTTEQDFPADLWSQRDAFHNHEAGAVRDQAFSFRVSYEDVLRAIDEDLHRGNSRERNANAIPCKPRPFYD